MCYSRVAVPTLVDQVPLAEKTRNCPKVEIRRHAETIHVAVGAVVDECGRVLVTRRPDHVHQGGLWEFPGGKLEPGEDLARGLERELREELGIRVGSSEPLIRVQHDYGDRCVLLDVCR